MCGFVVTFAELALKRGSLQFSPCNANILLAAFSFYTNMYKYVSSVCGVADGWSRKRRVRPARSDTNSLQFQSRYSHAKVCVGRVRCCRRLVSETKGAPCSVQQLALCNSNLVFLMQKYLTKSICALFVLCRACALL